MIQYKNVHDNNIILLYKGVLTFDLLSTLISTAEKRINDFETDRRTQKKFYSILTESLQNMHYHVEKVNDVITDFNTDTVLIMILAKKRHFLIKTCNYVSVSQMTKLKEKIDMVNSLDKEALKALYAEALSNNEFSNKNTAGLGLLEISRKAEYPLTYSIEKVDDQYSYFNLEIQLDRGVSADPSKGRLAVKM